MTVWHLTERGWPASVRQVHPLSGSLRSAVRWGWLTVNPAVSTRPPPLRHQPEPVPTPAEVQKMIRGAEREDSDMAVLITLAAITGARRGELCGLRWGDVDWDAGTLAIERSVAVMAEARRS